MNQVHRIGKIQIPGMDEEEVLANLQARLKARGITEAEVERIEKLDFSPEYKDSESSFNAAETIDLFDSPVKAPRFKTSRYWFMVGPVRRLIVKLYDLISLLFSKLSENRSKAFHNLVGALIAQERRIRDLELQNSGYSDVNIKPIKSRIAPIDLPPEYANHINRLIAILSIHITGERPEVLIIDDYYNFLTDRLPDSFLLQKDPALLGSEQDILEVDAVVIPEWNDQSLEPELNLSRLIPYLRPGGIFVSASRRSDLKMYSVYTHRYENLHRQIDSAMNLRQMQIQWWETDEQSYYSIWKKK